MPHSTSPSLFAHLSFGLFAVTMLSSALLAQKPPAAPAPDTPVAPAVLKAPVPANLAEAKRMAVQTYAQIAEAVYSDALSQAIELRKDIKAFVARPDVPKHISAKLSWLEARMPYLQSEALRFAGGPIDSIPGLERSLNGWPVDAAFIDATKLDPKSGLVNDAEALPKISPEAISALVGKAGDAKKITSGYHAIELLLWGEDSDPKSAGKRTHADYIDGGENNAARRGAYLVACGDLLVRQLSDLLAQWRPDKPDNYRAAFDKIPVDDALAIIFSGVSAAVDEFSRNRLGAPYAAKDGALEQSNFSDTTHIDVLHNTAGLANLAAGAYVGLDGKVRVLGVGMVGLADQVSAAQGEKIRTAINAAYQAASKVDAPFDQEVLGDDTAPGRVKIKALIDSLGDLGKELSDLAAAVAPKPE